MLAVLITIIIIIIIIMCRHLLVQLGGRLQDTHRLAAEAAGHLDLGHVLLEINAEAAVESDSGNGCHCLSMGE